jgi:hypothetical protein
MPFPWINNTSPIVHLYGFNEPPITFFYIIYQKYEILLYCLVQVRKILYKLVFPNTAADGWNHNNKHRLFACSESFNHEVLDHLIVTNISQSIPHQEYGPRGA